MWRIAWANVRGHLLRTVATTASVVFGVAFVTGTFVFTDTVRDAFEQLFGSTVEGADLIVVAAGTSDDATSPRTGVSPDVADAVAQLPEVAAAEPRYRGLAKLARDDGTALGGFGSLLQGVDTSSMPGAFELRSGALPTGDNEVAIDAASAIELGKAVDDEVALLLNGPQRQFRITGIVEPPPALIDLAGSTTAVFSDKTARRLYGADGATYIAVRAADGADISALREQLALQVGAQAQVLTLDQLVADSMAQLGDVLEFMTRGLLVFAGAAVLVGAVIIFNTFAITVAQRTRELALVQAVGADGAQVLRAVLIEAFILGCVGSVAGVVVGVGSAVGLQRLLRGVDMPLPATQLVLHPRSAAIGVTVGVGVSLLAAVGPAVRAARRAPVEALRTASAGEAHAVSTPRLLVGWLFGGVALALLVGSTVDRGGMIGLAAGASLLTAAIVLLAPLGAAPLVAVVGAPLRAARRLPGLLARANAIRSPGRTAATATALLIGLGIVTFALILVSSLRSSLDRVIVDQFRADYQLQPVDGVGFPTAVTAAAADIDGVGVVSSAKVTRGSIDGATRTVFAVDPATFGEVYGVTVLEGSIAALTDGGVAVSKKLGVPLGSTVPVAVDAAGAPDGRQVVALIDDVHLAGTTRVGQAIVDVATATQAVQEQQDLVAFVTVAPGADGQGVRTQLEQTIASQPDVRLADTAALRSQVRDQTNRLLSLVIGLVLLSVIIAFIGVVNALGLSVVERTDELGLLQALGMTQRQARQMVRWESVIVTVLGTVSGVALGIVFGWLGVRALGDDGLSTFSLPVAQIAAAVVIMLIAGVVASVVPARRASNVNVLRAVTVE